MEIGRRKKRKTRIVNVYNKHLRADQMYNRVTRNTRRRVLIDMDWKSIIEARVVFLRNFNAHSPN